MNRRALLSTAVLGALFASPKRAQACDASLPNPPLLVVLPDGTEVPADRLEFDYQARKLYVIRDGVFCDGFEN